MIEGKDSARQNLNTFFVSVQVKALRQTEYAVKNKDDALDIVQDAMTKLAEKYADKPEDWGPLFQRILQNTIRDWYRRQKVKRFFSFSQSSVEEKELSEDSIYPGASQHDPESNALEDKAFAQAKQALAQLPLRQQQAFILRAWWGHDVAETAFAMKCSQGSVKTHYSRATSRLKHLLEGRV